MDLFTIRSQLNRGIPLTSLHLRVTDYARVSTDHIEQKKSLKNQVEHFEHFIKENKNWTYISGYIDEGITGTSDIKRDNFMRMIEDARFGKFDLIVTKEISRFSRNTLDSIKYTRELLSFGVAVLFVNDNINTALPDAELRLTIMASMAQDEIRRLSERVKFGMHRAIARGEILGNDMMYGYKKDKDTGNLDIIEEEAQIVRKIYEYYAIEEFSLSKIATILNRENTKERKKWSTSGISRMIENPKYKGYYCAKKSEIIDYMTKKIKYFAKEDWILYKDNLRVPPIIEEELWERANLRLEKRKKSFCNKPKEESRYKNRYVYSAKIYCKEHNTLFHRREFRRGKKDVTWVCSEYLKKGKKVCDSPNIRESELNYIFENLITKLQIDITKVEDILLYYYQDREENTKTERELLVKKKSIEAINRRKDKLLELNIQEIITNEEFKERNKEWNEKIKSLKEEMIELKNKQDNLQTKEEKKQELKECIKTKINLLNVKTKIIKEILDHIFVSKIEKDKNNLVLDIFLTYEKQEKKESPQIIMQYDFKRGYDTRGTKRYTIYYQVNCYF